MRLKLHLFISLVIIVCTLKTNAQNTTLFPVDNFFMNEYHSEKSIPNPFLFDYEEGSIFTKDHYTKNNKTYYQLYYNYSYFKNTSPNGHTSSGFNQRHIGDLNYDTLLNKVFLNDVLLYDFSLNEGDIYPVTCQHLDLDSNIRVVNIDTIVDPYNIIRKVFYINNFNHTNNCSFSYSSSCAVIIEGIGSVNGILGPLFDCFEDCSHKLNCAKINNKNYEFSNGISIGSCSIIQFVGINISKKSEISISPNPVTSTFTINIPDEEATFTILNTLGQIQKTQIVREGSIWRLDASLLENGIYFVNILTDKNQYSSRFIKAN